MSCHRKLCYFATGIFVFKHRHISNNTFAFCKYPFRTSCNNKLSANKARRSLHNNVCFCVLEFQMSNIPTHSKRPSLSTSSTFYVPIPPSSLGYNIRSECLLFPACSRHVGKGNFDASSINKVGKQRSRTSAFFMLQESL